MSIDDLLPGLAAPLWEGTDEEFTKYVRDVFEIPQTLTRIQITPRASSGRSAVAIADSRDGAIIFAITPDPATRKTRVAPIAAGPICKDVDLVRRMKASSVDKNIFAISALMLRHLPLEVVTDLVITKAD